MPTPSSNAPDPQSPRSYPFSSCPDPDEQQSLQPQSQSTQSQPLQLQPVHSSTQSPPSDWSARAPPPYSADSETQVSNSSMGDEGVASRSPTMSPGPQPDSTCDLDEPEGMVISQDHDHTDESYKQANDADTDVNMLGVASTSTEQSPVTIEGDNRGIGVVLPPATTRTPVESALDSRRRQKAPTDLMSPTAGTEELDEMEIWDSLGNVAPRWAEDSGLAGMGYEYSHRRVMPTSPSSYLRPGSRFTGTQQSARQRYEVQVEIKHVDMRESFLCGYLRIQGLTNDHPTLTTYFEGEIIGSKYGFITQHPSWGATDKDDLSHWAKFTAFRPWAKQARKGGQVLINDVAQKENIFMRWKEHFLVPDHRVRTINGASFEGFYYICFNQVRGEVSGIYFHSKSEKFQQLELKHVEDKGCYGAMEFR
ncbi:vacuolar import and degradation protein-domain-containing protein [Apodospora peruviana]|uniref:Vacuolar import and degradation protein-domain-containing protein n=1 Tax=Apodospora peruviana TaxID=516989 RepID=A0AAE0I5X4_9PEZI|nr:vacuolar import and degradation protein-domain-containing protein [Apodospora peruviana]